MSQISVHTSRKLLHQLVIAGVLCKRLPQDKHPGGWFSEKFDRSVITDDFISELWFLAKNWHLEASLMQVIVQNFPKPGKLDLLITCSQTEKEFQTGLTEIKEILKKRNELINENRKKEEKS